MIISVISDTHRKSYGINKAIMKSKGADIIIHLGDNVEDAKEIQKQFKGRVIYVAGNCDPIALCKTEEILEIEGRKIFITHGNRYDVNYGISELLDKAKLNNFDLVLYGHTHISRVDYEEGIFFVNPGSPSMPRDNFKSIARIDITKEHVIPTILTIE